MSYAAAQDEPDGNTGDAIGMGEPFRHYVSQVATAPQVILWPDGAR